jgi:hypothetical protein
MKRPPSRYSADGRWWWDGEQWQPVERSHLPVPVEPPRRARREPRWRWRPPRVRVRLPRPSRAQLVAAALLGAAMALAMVLPPPAALLRLRPPALPSVRLPLPTATPTPRPAATPRPTATPTRTPKPTPTPTDRSARYRHAAADGAARVGARIDAVDQGCTAPANLAVCRAALVALHAEVATANTQLNEAGTPSCLGPADVALRRALTAIDGAGQGTIAGIDAGDPGPIVTGVQAVDGGRAALAAAVQQAQTAAC